MKCDFFYDLGGKGSEFLLNNNNENNYRQQKLIMKLFYHPVQGDEVILDSDRGKTCVERHHPPPTSLNPYGVSVQ